MQAAFSASDLIGLFRQSLVALIPIAEQARIAWREPAAYDPWERIEQALFNSIVRSVVENGLPDPPRPLAGYCLAQASYAELSFFTDATARRRGERLVFQALATTKDPFDAMRFQEVDAAFVPTGRAVDILLATARPELAARFADGLRYIEIIRYAE